MQVPRAEDFEVEGEVPGGELSVLLVVRHDGAEVRAE